MEIVVILLLIFSIFIITKLLAFFVKLFFGIVLIPFQILGAFLGSVFFLFFLIFFIGIKLMLIMLILLPIIIPLLFVGLIVLLVK